jgi:hypothetical protein
MDGETHDFSQINWSYDDGLTDTQPSNEATSVNSTKAAPITHKDSDSNDPQHTKLACGPDTTDAITD